MHSMEPDGSLPEACFPQQPSALNSPGVVPGILNSFIDVAPGSCYGTSIRINRTRTLTMRLVVSWIDVDRMVVTV